MDHIAGHPLATTENAERHTAIAALAHALRHASSANAVGVVITNGATDDAAQTNGHRHWRYVSHDALVALVHALTSYPGSTIIYQGRPYQADQRGAAPLVADIREHCAALIASRRWAEDTVVLDLDIVQTWDTMTVTFDLRTLPIAREHAHAAH